MAECVTNTEPCTVTFRPFIVSGFHTYLFSNLTLTHHDTTHVFKSALRHAKNMLWEMFGPNSCKEKQNPSGAVEWLF